MSGRRTAGLVVLAIAPAIGIMAFGFADIARDGAWGVCWTYGLRLLFWGIVCCLVGTFVCTALFAVCRAPSVAYAVLVAALALVAGAGWGLGMSAETDCASDGDLGSSLFVAGLCLVASLFGLVLGGALGLLVQWLTRRPPVPEPPPLAARSTHLRHRLTPPRPERGRRPRP